VHQGCDAHVLADLLSTSPRLPVLAGLDDLMYVALLLGAECIVSSLAALFPEECIRLYHSVLRSEHDAARRIHERTVRLWRALDDPAEFAARMKYTSNALHRPIGIARSPYDVLRNASQARLVRALAAEGFL
jgi:dihydrodipicolinate synthase/N-acetylneuraminate lyase